MRGRSLDAKRLDDALKYALHIRQGLVVPESDHAIPLPGEKCRPLGVGSLLQPVLSAVELDDKLGFRAAEVRDEGPIGCWRRNLAPQSRRSRNRDQSFLSTSVWDLRRRRA